ncbi:TIGR02147 family protein [Bdellovibrio sp. KM01]|uniref:TIGR02147 family protein n=1 Tax=Bdellovibrio sp. KM01 TaxID=2748865 RepID=UPI0015EAA3E3|nr:TIGR02147 family protein [Bdellovibrio sp. KM01]QLY23909.1 TIGR02147 family protein [Bdellovibrio sp. KM01]
MNIFEYEDYRNYLKDFLALEENQASGRRKQLLASANMSSSYLTQILAGTKHLSSEQAYEMALDMGLTEKETDYLLVLVDIGRVGTVKLRERLMMRLRTLQAESKHVSAKVSTDRHLTDQQKAVYYSNWLYTAVRNLVPTEQGRSIKDIAMKLNVPEPRVESAVQFLIDVGLVGKFDDGLKYRRGYTHLDASDPLIFRHHQNWRQRAIQRMDHYNENHLHYTCPMAISKDLAMKLRAQLLEEIKRLNQSMKDAPEVSYCLNIDLFEY